MMRKFTIERASLWIVFALLFAIAIRVPADTDTWWHIRSGEYTLTQGIIRIDPFSHTHAGEAWINHSWGSQILLFGIWQIAGNAGLAIYTAVLAVGGMAMLYPVCAGNTYLRAFVLILGASAAAVFWSARPQMLSFFFSTVVIFLIYDYKRYGRDHLWWFIPLIWLWGNLHAGWSIAYLLLFAFIVGEAFNKALVLDVHGMGWAGWRKLLLVTALSIPTLLISPYGLDNLLVPINTVNIGPLRDFIQEWNSPNFQGRETWPFIALMMSLVGALWASRLKFDWSGFFLLIGTLFLALLYGRNIAVFAVAATPILTHHLHNALQVHGIQIKARQTVSPRMGRLNALLAGVVVLGVVIYALSVLLPATVEDAQSQFLPIDATAYLNQHTYSGNMFNSYNWGGYLMFAAPQYDVFIDGRTDLYGDFLNTYLDTALGQAGWRETFADYGINLVMVEKSSGLDQKLREEMEWELVYEDDMAVIHVREGAGNEAQ